jgi:hypothetical protein
VPANESLMHSTRRSESRTRFRTQCCKLRVSRDRRESRTEDTEDTEDRTLNALGSFLLATDNCPLTTTDTDTGTDTSSGGTNLLCLVEQGKNGVNLTGAGAAPRD